MTLTFYIICSIFFFFFQAEDGIRDVAVTGVQTCALPISPSRVPGCGWSSRSSYRSIQPSRASSSVGEKLQGLAHQHLRVTAAVCRERLAQRPVRFGRRVPQALQGVERRFRGSTAGGDARRDGLLKVADLVRQFKRQPLRRLLPYP